MRRSTLLLLVCCGSLAAVTYYEFMYYDPLSEVLFPVTEEDSHTDVPDVDSQYDFPPLLHFREISKRPLFSPSRRPAPRTHANLVDAYRLRGVFLFEKRKFGLVERLSDGTSIRVSEGDVVDAWRVAFIDDEAIGLSDSIELHTLRISQAREEDIASSAYEASTGGNSQETIHHEVIDSEFEEDLYAENGLEEEVNMPWDLHRRSGHADHPRLRPDRRAYAADGRAPNYALAVPRKPLRLPPPPPPVL